jgi:hypothetical protein
VLLTALLFCTLLPHLPEVQATSIGFERYSDEYATVSTNYFPVVPFDVRYPSAMEQFAFTFSISENSFMTNIVTYYVGNGFQITILVDDELDYAEDEYLAFTQWFPVHIEQYGLKFGWSLSLGGEKISLGAGVEFSPIRSITCDYNSEYRGDWYYLSYLNVQFDDRISWALDQTWLSGGGSIGVENGVAQHHVGHPFRMYVHFCLWWVRAYGVGPDVLIKFIDFIVGDGTPLTDCLLKIQPANSTLTLTPLVGSTPGSGGGALCRAK